jgi:LmbE family N-acetylglucosaminyl deacetylase
VTVRTVTAAGLPATAWRTVLLALPGLPALPPAGSTVVVVAAHPDDETLAAAGLLQRLARLGVRTRFVVATDGEAGYPDREPEEREELAARRRKELRRALSVTGYPHARPTFAGLPDGDVAGHEDALADALAGPLAKADLCLAPWELDPHPDHRATGRAALRAVARARERRPQLALWRYPVWMRHSLSTADAPRGLRALRLTPEEVAGKRRAVECHASQLVSPHPDQGPVLPEHVLALFDDGVEAFLIGTPA